MRSLRAVTSLPSLLALALFAAFPWACSSPTRPPPDAAPDVVCTPPQLRCASACVDPSADPSNCGMCGRACAAGSMCMAGDCIPVCTVGQTRCAVTLAPDASAPDASPPDASILDGAARDGAARDGGAVDSAAVVDAAPPPPDAPRGLLATVCTDLATDALNCGGCGRACAVDHVCSGAACVLLCHAPAAPCGDRCAMLDRDAQNCGACGTACGAGQTCVAGACAAPLAPFAPRAVSPPALRCTTAAGGRAPAIDQGGPAGGRKVAVDRTNTLYVAMSCSPFRGPPAVYVTSSADGGATFSPAVPTGLYLPSQYAIQGGPGRTVYAAAFNANDGSLRVTHSIDAGASWAPVTQLVSVNGATIIDSGTGLGLASDGARVVVAVASPMTGGVRTWRNAAAGVGPFEPSDVAITAPPNFVDVLVNPADHAFWLGVETGNGYQLFRSTDGAPPYVAFTLPPSGAGVAYSDLALGGDSILAVGARGNAASLYRLPLSAGSSPSVIVGLVDGSGPGTARAISAAASGEAFIAEEVTGTVALQRVASGAPMAQPLRTIAMSGAQPAVIALGAPGLAFVAYTDGAQVLATVLGP